MHDVKGAKEPAAPIICRIEMPLPENYPTYHREITTAHPDASFEVLSRSETDKGDVIEDINVSGRLESKELEDELKMGRNIKEVEVLETSELASVFRVTLKKTPVTKIYSELHLLMRYPVDFSGGVVKLLVVAHTDKVQKLFSRLKEIAPGTTISAIHHNAAGNAPDTLTPRQREVFKLAMDAGYWDVPRRTNLTSLATQARVSKSTMWETLATIEMKLMRDLKEKQSGIFGQF